MDNAGYLYFGLLANHAICKWDSYRPFTYDNQQIVARDKVHIQWTDGKFRAMIHDFFCFCLILLKNYTKLLKIFVNYH